MELTTYVAMNREEAQILHAVERSIRIGFPSSGPGG